jgi:hypothetical protein
VSNILTSTAGELQLETPAEAPIVSRTFFDIALEENGLIQMCPGAQTTEAKHGVFMPLRLLGPTQPFVRPALAADQRVTTSGSASPALFSVAEHYVVESEPYDSDIVIPAAPFVLMNLQENQGNYDSYQPWWVWASLDNANTEAIYDTAFDFCATGVSIFRGLDNQASFTVQVFVSMENVVNSTSVFRSLTGPGAPYDRRALQAYYDIVNAMPFCYPASYNELGAILPYIGQALSVIGPLLLPEVEKLGKAAWDAGKKWVGGKVSSMMVTPAARNPTPAMRAVVAPVRRPAPASARAPRTVAVARRDGELKLERHLQAMRARSASKTRAKKGPAGKNRRPPPPKTRRR